MLFRLALALGKTLEELRVCLPSSEFKEWCAYYTIEPWGDFRADMRSGMVAASIWNVYASFRGAKPTATAQQFMPFLVHQDAGQVAEVEAPPARELTDEQLAAFADAAIFGIPPGAEDATP